MKQDIEAKVFRTLVIVLLAAIVILLVFIHDDPSQLKQLPVSPQSTNTQQA